MESPIYREFVISIYIPGNRVLKIYQRRLNIGHDGVSPWSWISGVRGYFTRAARQLDWNAMLLMLTAANLTLLIALTFSWFDQAPQELCESA